MPQDSFTQVKFDDESPNPCSPPEQPPDWTGVLINVPSRAYLSQGEPIPETEVIFGRIPVCGYSVVELTKLADDENERIVAIDVVNGQRYANEVREKSHDLSEPPPETESSPDRDLSGLTVGGYFTINLNHHLTLPAAPATYEIYVTHGPYESNRATLEVLPWTKGSADRTLK